MAKDRTFNSKYSWIRNDKFLKFSNGNRPHDLLVYNILALQIRRRRYALRTIQHLINTNVTTNQHQLRSSVFQIKVKRS